MTALNFPSSPTLGQTYTANGGIWEWNGTAWVSKNILGITIGETGSSSTTGTGSVVLSTSPTLVTPNLGTPSVLTLTNATELPIVAGTTGTLSTDRGGTGAATLTGVVIGNGVSAFTAVTAPTGDFIGTTDTQTLTNKTVEKLILNDGYTEEVFAVTDGVTVNLDPNNGSIQTWTLGANRTPGEVNWAAGQSITLMVDDGAAFAITWTTLAVIWKTDEGVAPTLNTTGFTVIVLWKVGTTIYGARAGDS